MRTAVRSRLELAALVLAAGPCCADAQTPERIAPDVDWANAEIVAVTMVNYEFVPDRLSFRRGVPYRLHLENHGSEIHDFSAPEFFKAIELRNPEVLGSLCDADRGAAERSKGHGFHRDAGRLLRADLRRPRLGRHDGSDHGRVMPCI